VIFALLACEAPPITPLDETACPDASARLGATVCLHQIDTKREWDTVATDAAVVDQDLATKYLVPVHEDEVLPSLFVNANLYALHYDFLREVFPDAYATMTWEQYVAMIIDRDVRRYYGGNVTEYLEPDGTRRFGFIVWDDPADANSTVTYEEVHTVWVALQERFGRGSLMFVPGSSNQREAAATWTDAPFTIRGESDLDYEAYNVGVGYGTVQMLDLADLDAATAAATFGWQDILVLDEAPFDLERIVSGSVTGSRQGALSHVNVRAAARGTPNCFLEDPHEALAAWEGALVRFECGEAAWSIALATPEEAQAWWDALQPDPVDIPAMDLTVTEAVPLLEVPTTTVSDRDVAVTRYGAKGANLATLYQRTDAEVQLEGFVTPFAWYDDFMHANTWEVDGVVTTFADTLDAWIVDPTFLADGGVRAERLAGLRAAMVAAPVDPAVIDALEIALLDTYGDDTTMVRLRSSSNAEDGVVFSGAGLYESASACLADERSGETTGDSLCDPDKKPKLLSDALRTVWASLWGTGAWEERAWYGVDQARVGMAVLVNTQTEDELANIVGFTGHPSVDDPRWLVEAQLGDLDVVSAEPGVWPEQLLLTLDDGVVTTVEHVSTSSEAERVLSDAQIEAVGELLWEIDLAFPSDDVPASGTLMWDTEMKFLADGRLIVKQVRPFVRD
jgi:pyruvate,water dikinase